MNTNVLWADDDCDRFLAPLGRILDRQSTLSVKSALTFLEALEILEGSEGADNHERIHSVLLDIILPYDREGRGALMADLGIKLADRAAGSGVKVIAFLTVVRRDEVADKFTELQKTHPGVDFGYFDKTNLLDRNELQSLIDLLASSHNKRPEDKTA